MRAVLTLVPTLALLSVAAFLLTLAARGDPAQLALQQDGQTPTPEVLGIYRQRLGLDAPLPVRYIRWLGSVAHGDLGQSSLSNRPVTQVLGEHLVPTLLLGGAALFVSTLTGVLLGIVLASCSGSALEVGARTGLSILAAVPSFWLSFALILVLGERWRLLPVAGYGTWQQFILPVLALSVGPTVSLARLTRGLVLDTFHESYVRTAQGKGLGDRWVNLRHILPNVAGPLVALTGVRLGHILGGAIVIEAVFGWPGMGSVLVTAVSGRDVPVICGYILLTGCVVIFARMLSDAAASVFDPRLRGVAE
jgi:ABC-type dipeptide/oligopeptide/nickel transport system permease component